MTIYRVRDWEKHFETAKTLSYKNKSNYTMPLKFGLGYTRLLKSENGPAMFGAFCATICVLSQHEPPRSGWLTENGKKDGQPLDAEAISDITRFPVEIIEKMLFAVSSKNIDWLNTYDKKENFKEPCVPDKEPCVPDKEQMGRDILNLNLNSNLNLNLNSNTMSCDDVGEQKKNKMKVLFEKFWACYPKRKSRGDAEKAFNAIKPDERLVETMISTIKDLATTQDWLKDNGRYVPYPATWLRAKGWLDESRHDVPIVSDTTLYNLQAAKQALEKRAKEKNERNESDTKTTGACGMHGQEAIAGSAGNVP